MVLAVGKLSREWEKGVLHLCGVMLCTLKGFSKSFFCKIRLFLCIRDSQIKEFISRDSQVVEKCLADNQGIKMSESQGWDLYAVHI